MGFCTKNDEICIQNDNICIKNDEFCSDRYGRCGNLFDQRRCHHCVEYFVAPAASATEVQVILNLVFKTRTFVSKSHTKREVLYQNHTKTRNFVLQMMKFAAGIELMAPGVGTRSFH